jgi:iron complex outermembrane receptor protein
MFCVPVPAFAQGDLGTSSIEEIVVTAQKRQESIQDVPISMAAIGGDEIQRTNAQSVKELVGKVSGVLIQDHYGTNTFYVIRGIGLNDFRSNSSPSAAVYVDEVYQGGMLAGSPPTYDVDRLEILKGPQGTLYGRNASSGAVNLITRKPTEEFEGYAKVGIGRFTNVLGEGVVSGPISDSLMYRLSAQYSSYEDTVHENVSPLPAVRDVRGTDAFVPESVSVRGQVLFQPGNDTDVLIKGTLTSKSGSTANSVAIPRLDSLSAGDPPCPGFDGSLDANFAANCTAGFELQHIPTNASNDRETNHNFVSENDLDFWELALTIDHDLDWAELISITAYSAFETDQNFDFDATISEGLNVRQAAESNSASQELRLANVSEEGISWMLGANVAYEEYEEPQRTFYAGVLDDSGPFPLASINYSGAPGRVSPTSPHFATRDTEANTLYQDIAQDTTSYAVFTDNEIRLTGALSLVAGYRYTYEKREFTGAAYVGFTDGATEFTNQDGVGDADGSSEAVTKRSSGRLGLNWRPSDSILVYGTFSESFKSGGFDAGFLNNVLPIINPYKPEIVRSFEVGFKSDPRDNLRLNAAIFYSDFDDPQTRLTTNVTGPGGIVIPQTILSNLDEARVMGLEGEIAWRAAEYLTLGATASLMDSEVDDPANPAFDGNPLSHAPEQTFTVDGVYERPVGDNLTLRLQANMKYLSDHFLRAEATPIDEQEAYTTVDAQVSLAHQNGGWEVSVFARNLADEFYFVDGQGGFGANRYTIGMPRTYGVTATFNF